MFAGVVSFLTVFTVFAQAHTVDAKKSRYAEEQARPDDVGLYDKNTDWKRSLVGKDSLDKVFTMLAFENPWICRSGRKEFENIHQLGVKAYEAMEDKHLYEARYGAEAKKAFANAQSIEDFLRAGRKFRFTEYGDKAMGRAIDHLFDRGAFFLVGQLAEGLLFDSHGDFREPRQDDAFLSSIAMSYAQTGNITKRDRILKELTYRKFTHLTVADELVPIKSYIESKTLEKPPEFNWKKNIRFLRQATTYGGAQSTSCEDHASYSLKDSETYFRPDGKPEEIGKLHARHFSGEPKDLVALMKVRDPNLSAIAGHTLVNLPDQHEQVAEILAKYTPEEGLEPYIASAGVTALPWLQRLIKIPLSGKLKQIAVTRIGEFGSKGASAYATIGALLDHISKDLRFTAYSTLVKIGGSEPTLVPNLFAAVKKQPDDRVVVARALHELSEGKIAELIPYLKDPDPLLRYTSALALGELGRSAGQAVAGLRLAATDADLQVRFTVLDALGKIEPQLTGPASAMPELITALDDEDPSIRFMAATAAAEYRGRAISVVPALVRQILRSKPDFDRVTGIKALAQIPGDPKIIVPALVKVIEGEKDQKEAIESLANHGTKARDAGPAILAYIEKTTPGFPERGVLPILASLYAGTEPPKELVTLLENSIAIVNGDGLRGIRYFPSLARKHFREIRASLQGSHDIRVLAAEVLIATSDVEKDREDAFHTMVDAYSEVQGSPRGTLLLEKFKELDSTQLGYIEKLAKKESYIGTTATQILSRLKK